MTCCRPYVVLVVIYLSFAAVQVITRYYALPLAAAAACLAGGSFCVQTNEDMIQCVVLENGLSFLLSLLLFGTQQRDDDNDVLFRGLSFLTISTCISRVFCCICIPKRYTVKL